MRFPLHGANCGAFFGVPLFVAVWLSAPASAWSQIDDSSVEYEKQIKHLFFERCVSCHGGLKQEAGLRLDTGELIRRGSEQGPVLDFEKVTDSVLIQRVTSDDPATRMPPDGERLKSEQVQALQDWISNGAKSPIGEEPEANPREHWAFRPVSSAMNPNSTTDTKGGELGQNLIDTYFADYQAQHGLKPSPIASRHELIRRLYLDLIGMPPSAEEYVALERDQADGWYERLVDRLLSDARYGERWGRHWMDVWRYSDWWGLGDQLRNSQLHMWHWRDWIIESLNDDVPYDEMVRQMLAADELYPTDLSKIRATGFLARNYFLFNRNQWMEETVEHVNKAFLGLTMNCVKCHEHKYDPIPQAEFYKMRAFFEPYFVRLDPVPDEPNLIRNGIPRVFDAQELIETFRFERGQESQPDKSIAMLPEVPEILRFDELDIRPVALPPEAWQPERFEWVQKSLVDTEQRNVAEARKQLDAAIQHRDEAKAKSLPSIDALLGNVSKNGFKFADEFHALDLARWVTFGGQWKIEAEKLRQLQDGPDRSVLRLRDPVPTDFDATFRFSIDGGSQWRSVGIAFDVTQVEPLGSAAADDTEQLVYLSGVNGGSKIQIAQGRAGQWSYPNDAMLPQTVELGKPVTMRIQVRGRVIHVLLDEKSVLCWETPLERRRGSLQVICFDAIATINRLEITELSTDAIFPKPSNATSPEHELKLAELEAASKQANLSYAETKLQSLQKRIDASKAKWQLETHPDSASIRELATTAKVAAIRSEQLLALHSAGKALSELEITRLKSAPGKLAEVDQEIVKAKEALQSAEKKLGEAVEESLAFTPLQATSVTPTRFLSSTKDDPLPTLGARSTGRRSALAKWITDPRNPLTARVAVNHIWTRHFGTSLVDNMFDLGRKSRRPVHAELLDTLAADWMTHGWNMKRLHRLIVTSQTYRLSSSLLGTESNQSIDRENVGYWRRTPIRLEAEVIRDSLLQFAGSLDSQLGGPSVSAAEQSTSRRRSLYFFHSNNERSLFLTTFDEAPVKECYRREQSIVPQQALALTNSAMVLDAISPIAARLSDSILSQRADATIAINDRRFVQFAFERILGIDASDFETQLGVRAIDRWRTEHGKSNQEAYSQLVWVLLNHNDFVTLR